MLAKGTRVEVFTEVSDGQDDVMSAWTPGTVVGEYTVSASIQHSTGQRPGIIVNVPESASRNKNIRIEDGMVDTVVRTV